ncbi:MAG: hypothetical protein HIU81_10200 [Acidobacteria bacterium]|nr:hypothetical protein [Acidobacteriota bacterium]
MSSLLPALSHGPQHASLLPPWLDPEILLNNPGWGFGVVVLACAIIFAETGLLIGFFLPGDSLLFTAGLLTASGIIHVNIFVLTLLLIVCAFVGNQVGYLIGLKIGPAIFNRPDSRFFRQEHVISAHNFFERHGGKALILARFVPIVRTFVPVITGVAKLELRTFTMFNAIGAILWAGGVTLLGYALGNQFPWVRSNLDIIFVVIVLLSVLPIIIGFLRSVSAKKSNPS